MYDPQYYVQQKYVQVLAYDMYGYNRLYLTYALLNRKKSCKRGVHAYGFPRIKAICISIRLQFDSGWMQLILTQ